MNSRLDAASVVKGTGAITIELALNNPEQVEDGVISLGFIEGPFDKDVLGARLIGADEIAAVAAAGHPQVGSALSAHSLANCVVILREPGSGTRAMVEKSFAQIGLVVIEPMMLLTNTEAIKRVLMAQASIGFLSTLSVKEELQRGDLALIEVRELRIERPLHMVWIKGRSLAPSAPRQRKCVPNRPNEADSRTPERPVFACLVSSDFTSRKSHR
jgi:DNA-binding transcriptional LysR family regulator